MMKMMMATLIMNSVAAANWQLYVRGVMFLLESTMLWRRSNCPGLAAVIGVVFWGHHAGGNFDYDGQATRYEGVALLLRCGDSQRQPF